VQKLKLEIFHRRPEENEEKLLIDNNKRNDADREN
jgi:hypothetical protein